MTNHELPRRPFLLLANEYPGSGFHGDKSVSKAHQVDLIGATFTR